MNDNENKRLSDPDENGIRYYYTDSTSPSGGNGEKGGDQGRRPDRPDKNKRMRKNILKLVLVILVIFMVGGAVNALTGRGGNDSVLPSSGSPYIATLYVEGPIQSVNTDSLGRNAGYQHEWTLDAIDELISDERNKGMLIFIDSPGGGVYESDELYLKIKEYQDYTDRPVYAVMGSMAASGGYYISASCDRIYANRNTWTGSIGVTVGTMVDVSGLLDKYGVKTKTITSGKHKAMGSPYQEMTPEEEKIWQDLVDEAYEQFTGIVAEGRGLERAKVKELADGRILNAEQARRAGLIDEIGGIDEAYTGMTDELGIDHSGIKREDVIYYREPSLLDTLLGDIAFYTGRGEKSEAASILELTEKIERRPVSYMCEALSY